MCSFSQEKVMEMQWDLLIANFKDQNVVALVKANVDRISSGTSPHCAGTLKFGLKKAFELKKQQKKQTRGVLLRCPYYSCPQHVALISYLSLKAGVYTCYLCDYRGFDSHYLQCTGCGYDRTGSYASCRNCGKRFL